MKIFQDKKDQTANSSREISKGRQFKKAKFKIILYILLQIL